MKTTLAALAAVLLLAAPALAADSAKGGTPQTHHCEVQGHEVAKTKKECGKAGGTWAKGAPTLAPAPKADAKPAAPAAAPAK